MTGRDDDLRVRPGHIRDISFVGQVMRAARKAGHTGKRFGGGKNRGKISTFGRGRRAAAALNLRSNSRRVFIKTRVVRHQGTHFRSAPLARHVLYLRREGVTRDGAKANMFDAETENADTKGFAERCRDDRHHFRFIVSPEDALELTSLRAFTQDLMSQAERDLRTKLDWIAVDHWNTDNPHIHLLVRGRADDGQNLVISRDYICFGMRARASQLITLELGARSPEQIKSAQQKEVEAERWTGLDRVLQATADDGAGIADLRPDASGEDGELRLMLVGRAMKLEKLGLAEQIAPGQWTLKPGIEQTLRDLSIRGDIIKTMHAAMTRRGQEPDMSGFALHSGTPADPILGRLVERGLNNELQGAAYAVIEGVDGRTHHVRFQDLEATSDASIGAIVETRLFEDAQGRKRLTLAIRSDLTIEQQVVARGATWLDRRLLDEDARTSNLGFGAEVAAALEKRVEVLEAQGLARKRAQGMVFARDLLATLRKAELDDAVARIASQTSLSHQPAQEGDHIIGTYRERLSLASGRFVMIDDAMGFQLVPWRPALDKYLGEEIKGRVRESGIEWSFERKRDLGV